LRNGFKNTPKVWVYRCEKNKGKGRAVSYGLKFIADEHVMLCDSDLKKLASEEISEALTKYELLKLDLLILRRMNIGFFPKIIRADTLLSGERILKKSDLEKVLEADVRGYELEVAINQYFIDDSSERCAWSKSSAVNNYKYKKFKFLKGIYKDLKMYFAITKYIGFKNYLNQIKTFCRKEV
jgi:glycosyltransferase involved in cell wall biosynthesis